MNTLICVFSFCLINLTVLSQDLESDIIGVWIFDSINSETQVSTLKKSRKLKKNKVGFEFKKDGVVIVREDSFGCTVIGKNGKSKSFLGNIEGTWKTNDDNQIEVYMETFMGDNIFLFEFSSGTLEMIRRLLKPS